MKTVDSRIKKIALLIVIDFFYFGKWFLAFISLCANVMLGSSVPDPTNHWIEFHRNHPILGIAMFTIAIVFIFIILFTFKNDKKKMEQEKYKKFPIKKQNLSRISD